MLNLFSLVVVALEQAFFCSSAHPKLFFALLSLIMTAHPMVIATITIDTKPIAAIRSALLRVIESSLNLKEHAYQIPIAIAITVNAVDMQHASTRAVDLFSNTQSEKDARFLPSRASDEVGCSPGMGDSWLALITNRVLLSLSKCKLLVSEAAAVTM